MKKLLNCMRDLCFDNHPDNRVKSNLFPNTYTGNLETKNKWTMTKNEINFCQKLRFQIKNIKKLSPCSDTVEITDIMFLPPAKKAKNMADNMSNSTEIYGQCGKTVSLKLCE